MTKLFLLFAIIALTIAVLALASLLDRSDAQMVLYLDKDNLLQVQSALSKRGYTFEVLSGNYIQVGKVTTLNLQVRWRGGGEGPFEIELWNEDILPIYKKTPKELR